MDPNTYQLTFPAFVVAAVAVTAWFVRRTIEQSEKASEAANNEKKRNAEKKETELEERFKEQGQRTGTLSERLQHVELSLANKVGREELERIYEKIDAIKAEIKEDFKDFRNDLLAAIGQSKKGDGHV